MKVSQVSPWLDNEYQFLKDTIDQSWLTEGKYANAFLSTFNEKTKTKYSVLAPNGTLGLYLALLALDLPKGSEVILPSFTFFGSASSIVFAGLTPVPVDVDLDDFSISLDSLKQAKTNNTSAIMAVHMYGQAAKLEKLAEFCKEHNLALIEDAAQAMGVLHAGKHAGTVGDIAMISFFADKTITMGEGSVVMTQREDLYERLKLLRNQGRPHSGTFIHPSLGMNFRVTDMQAAVGCMQLSKLDKIIEQRKETYNLYTKHLGDFKEARFMKIDDMSTHVPFRVAICLPHKEKTIKSLEESGYQTRSFFYPMHMQPGLSGIIKPDTVCNNAEILYASGICLPVHRQISEDNVIDISRIVRMANAV